MNARTTKVATRAQVARDKQPQNSRVRWVLEGTGEFQEPKHLGSVGTAEQRNTGARGARGALETQGKESRALIGEHRHMVLGVPGQP